MVTCELIGRMGNQMFQIATTIAHALRNDTKYKIPPRSLDWRVWPTYFPHLPLLNGIDKISTKYIEPLFSFTPIPFVANMQLSGYFQSEKYFKDYRKEIIEAFGFKWHPKAGSGTVAVHVRRGDYLQFSEKHPPVTKEYLDQAIAHFERMGRFEFLFFSDDMAWCRQHFGNKPNAAFVIDPEVKKDLQLMSCCQHQIISNSSYSWWGAWLNQNPDKIVVAPRLWFGPGNFHLDTKDLIPDTWIKI